MEEPGNAGFLIEVDPEHMEGTCLAIIKALIQIV
jgi:hypothetical protein